MAVEGSCSERTHSAECDLNKKASRLCGGDVSDSGCYGDLKKSVGLEHECKQWQMAAAVDQRSGHSYRGWVRVPWRTRATWEIHWERMLLRSWLTFGWLHIWGQNTNSWFKNGFSLTAAHLKVWSNILWQDSALLTFRPSGSQRFISTWCSFDLRWERTF